MLLKKNSDKHLDVSFKFLKNLSLFINSTY